MAVVRWLRPPPYKRLSLANKRAFSIIAEIPIAELEMKRRIRVCEREDCTLVAWYSSFYAPRTGGAYDSHHRTAELLVALSGAAAAWPLAARAQQAERIHTIGYLNAGAFDPTSPVLTSFLNALPELGWIEGKNVIIEYRFAENRLERLPEFAAELVRLKVDVIVGIGTLAPLAAKRATTTIPIVMTAAGDPLGSGLVASLARPGGNVTGMSLMAPELGGKRLELLKELLPRLARVAVLWNAANPYAALVFKETQTAGRALGIEVQSLEVRSPDDFNGAFETVRREHPDALITVEDPLSFNNRKLIADFAGGQLMAKIHGFNDK